MDLGNKIVLSTAYFANTCYFGKIISSGDVYVEKYENYIKQTYRNRCEILTANGKLALTIPIERTRQLKQKICDVKISYFDNWQKKHWRAIESAYNSSPFFEFYKDDLMPFFEKKEKYLFDFNFKIAECLLSLAGIEKTICCTDAYEKIESNLDFRQKISPKVRCNLDYPEYCQVFSSKFGFVPNLSFIDLLFNEGPNSASFLFVIF